MRLEDVFTDTGLKAAEAASRQCVRQLSTTGDTAAAGEDAVLLKENEENANSAAWVARIDENAIGRHLFQAPVLVIQGTADDVIPPPSTDLYVEDACKFRAPLFYIKYEETNHRTLLPTAKADFTTWIADRFANNPAPSNCPNAEIKWPQR